MDRHLIPSRAAFISDNKLHILKASYCTYYKRHSALKTAGCGTAHAIGAFISATGAAAAGGYIANELGEAFNGKRDNQTPRPICITKDDDTLCTS
jgi:hypothetical protein